MTDTEVLPIVFPFFGFIILLSSTCYCCLRRRVNEQYNTLETRINNLEQDLLNAKNTVKQNTPLPAAQAYPIALQPKYPVYPSSIPYPVIQQQAPPVSYNIPYSV